MSDEINEHAETEARLRAALSARADSVEPAPADPAAAIAAGAAAKRHRTFLAAAAVVALIAAVAGAALLLGGDGEEDVASGPDETTTTTTATTAPVEGSGAPVIWPLPTTSQQYETPEAAADAFMAHYLGISAGCSASTAVSGETTLTASCLLAPAPTCPSGGCVFSTAVRVEQRGLGWVVLGAESDAFDVTTPVAGDVVGANITVDVSGLLPSPVGTAELRPLGQGPGSAPTVDTNTIPLSADGSWHLILGAADGPVVLIVTDGVSATARVITVDGSLTPPPDTDDDVLGWPGDTSRVFDEPSAAALAFVTEVLGFAQPDERGGSGSETDAAIAYAARPTAGIETTITVHDTGTARGWVVTGVSSTEGTITEVTRNGDDITISGSASAFEANVNVRLYDFEGNMLGETTTMAGANGEQGPFTVTITRTVTTSEPAFVQIADHDASGEGAFIWATWAAVPAA